MEQFHRSFQLQHNSKQFSLSNASLVFPFFFSDAGLVVPCRDSDSATRDAVSATEAFQKHHHETMGQPSCGLSTNQPAQKNRQYNIERCSRKNPRMDAD